MNFDFNKYLEQYSEVLKLFNEKSKMGSSGELQGLGKRLNELEEIKAIIESIQNIEKEILSNKEILNFKAKTEEDIQLQQIACEEEVRLQKKIIEYKKQFQFLTIPRDPDDSRDVILEIRAGAGGDEAGLFAGDLFKMYHNFAINHGFRMAILDSSESGIGGVKELVAEIIGKNAYRELKFESGVHRVQRIPETEKNGRIHTSTATVAVLPRAEEQDVEIKSEEIRIDTFRSSGAGGQHVNRTESAIRITHLATGLVVSCQDEKSQHKNKAKAFSILRSRLLQAKKEKANEKMSNLRSSQIGTGDRSEKIRTYNFPQDRITDHRIKVTWHGIEGIFNGGLNKILDVLKQKDLELKIKKINE